MLFCVCTISPTEANSPLNEGNEDLTENETVVLIFL